MSGGFLTYTQIDARVRLLLRGCQLVCEVDWSEDLVSEVRKAWFFQSSYRPCDFVSKYPAVGVLMLVDHGIRNYSANEYWTSLKLGGPEQGRVGAAFERALVELELETFAQFALPSEKAKRFVAPILAHGGIPASMAGPFLRETLFPALRKGHGSSGAELVARWRRDQPAFFRSPIRRFLLYGGKTAVDLLDRLIALASLPRAALESGTAASGLPRHLVEAFLEVPEAEVTAPRAWLPRPSIELDPWGGTGPVLQLPPVGRELGANLTWLVSDGSGKTTEIRAYPRRDLQPIPLFPAPEWRVVAQSGADTLLDRTYECFGENPILCFGLDWTYLPDTEGIRADQAWILAHDSVRFASIEGSGMRQLAGETVAFRGAWSGNRVTKVDLRGVDLLASVAGDREVGRIPILRAARAEVVGDVLRDVLSQEGDPVVAQLPSISLPPKTAWTIRIIGPGISTEMSHSPSDLRATVPLELPVPSAILGRYEIVAEGPLGSDLRETFVLVPGFTVGTPDAPVSPGSSETVVPVRTTSHDVKFQGRGPGEQLDLVFPASSAREELWVFGREHSGKVGLFVTIPRIRWAFRIGDAPAEFGTARRSFDPDRLGEDPATLLVGVGRPDVAIRVLLLDSSGGEFPVENGRTDAAGRFRVDLIGIRDTARALSDLDLRLEFHIGAERFVVATHEPAHAASADDPRPRMWATVTAVVRDVTDRALMVEGEGWTGIAYEDHLPQPLSSYERGVPFTGAVIGYGEHVKLDGREFDASLFPLERIVTGRVAKVTGDGLVVGAYGHDLRVDQIRLPSDQPVSSWHVGDEVVGKVIYVNAERRLIRLSVAQFQPGSLRPGDEVEGVVYSTGDAIILRIGGLVGFIPPGGRPDGPVTSGSKVRGWVERVDRKHDQIVVTCRPFNSGGLHVGDFVTAQVTNCHDGDVWVRLPDGGDAMVPRAQVPPHFGPADLATGSSVKVCVTEIDGAARRIVASINKACDGYSFGGDDAAESPFQALRQLRTRRPE